MIVGVVLANLLLEGGAGVEDFGLVEFEFEVEEPVDVLLTELLSHLRCDHRRLLHLLIIIVIALLLLLPIPLSLLLPLLLFLLRLQNQLLLIQVHQIPLTLLQLLLVLIGLVSIHTLGE